MTETLSLRLVDEEVEATASAEPQVFVRSIAAPAGAPWDQARAAGLEARLGAPLPLSEVVYRLRRIEPWSFGRPGRYAAFYVRAREIGDRFETTTVVDGRSITIRLLSFAEQRRRAQRSLIIAGVAAASALLVFGAIGAALTTRARTTEALANVQQIASVRMRQARVLEALKAQTRALHAANVAGRSVSDYLNDLAWASASKAPGAHIDALHWDHGLMGVEARGDTAPFVQTDRVVVKADKPERPGVWLWGVGPAGSATAGSSSPPPPPANQTTASP